MSSTSRGAAAELTVATVLLLEGWDIFRALNPDAGADLIAAKDGELLRIQVRTGHRNPDGTIRFPRKAPDRRPVCNGTGAANPFFAESLGLTDEQVANLNNAKLLALDAALNRRCVAIKAAMTGGRSEREIALAWDVWRTERAAIVAGTAVAL